MRPTAAMPTMSPTRPTQLPSTIPSKTPTTFPSRAPTQPTKSPTVSPTILPTNMPSQRPTAPTEAPTQGPANISQASTKSSAPPENVLEYNFLKSGGSLAPFIADSCKGSNLTAGLGVNITVDMNSLGTPMIFYPKTQSFCSAVSW